MEGGAPNARSCWIVDHAQAIMLAERYVHLKRGARALDALKHASPELAVTWLWRANAFHQLQRYEEALESARHGLALEAENGYLHHAMARSFFMSSRFVEAEQAIVEALRLHPENAEAHAVHAMILAGTGKSEVAEKVIERAAHLGPELRGVRNARAFLTMNSSNAEELTRDLLQAEPEGAQEHWLRGVALVQSGRLREVADHFTRAAALEPDNPMFVKAARISRHWIFWPLRVTSPFSIWLAWYTLPITFVVAMFVSGEAWKLFWYSVAYVLYTYTAILAMIALPAAKAK